MELKWYGHAAFLLRYLDGTRIITDPYVPLSFDGAIRYGPIRDRADYVTVSHEHADHSGVGGLAGDAKVISRSGLHHAGGIVIRGFDSFHDSVGGGQRGRNVIFVFEAEGFRICHLGDLGHALGDRLAGDIGRVDVLLVPVGGVYTIDGTEAHQVAEKLAARVVIPMHYKTDKLDFGIAGVEDFVTHQRGVKNVQAASVDISLDRLPEAREIWVLKHEP